MHCASKYVPWRVRGLASCFHSSHVPLEEEVEISISKPLPQASKHDKVFNAKSHHKCGKKKMCRREDGGELVGKEPSTLQNKVRRAPTDGKSQKEATFTEENYLVFSFKKDGKIHLLDQENSSQESQENNHINTTNSDRPVGKKDDENRSNKMSTKSPQDDDKEERSKDVGNHADQVNASTSEINRLEDFCDSSETDSSSASSFTFPELGTEWPGSPVHMPRAEKIEQEPYHQPPYYYHHHIHDIRHCYRCYYSID